MISIDDHLQGDANLYSRIRLSSFFQQMERLPHRKVCLIWLLSLAATITLGVTSLAVDWSGFEVSILGRTTSITIFPTLIICTLWTLWFGFWWGFIPALLATFFLGGYAGMPIGWAALYAITDALGLGMLALGYIVISQPLTMNSRKSVLFYIFITFVAGVVGSFSSFIWIHTQNTGIGEMFSIWQGCWIGAFLQGILINGPLFYLFTAKVNGWKRKHLPVQRWSLPTMAEMSLFFSALALSVPLFILAADYLSFQAIADELKSFGDRAVLNVTHDAIRSTKLSTWIILILAVFTAYFGYEIAVTYTNALREAADKQARLLKKLEQTNMDLVNVNRQLESSRDDLAQLNSDKDRFFSIIAHDLKSPFSSLLGLSGLLDEDYENFEEDKKKKFIQAIHRSARQLYSLLQNLLQWANLQQGRIVIHPEKLYLPDLIRKNVALHQVNADKKNINIQTNCDADVMAYADRHMIDSTLRNLLSNALKFTRHGGTISIHGKSVDGKVVLTVADNGVGISKESMDALFDIEKKASNPGTDDEKGSGLGLILCKDFVEKNQGHIHVESELETGTTVTVELPAHVHTPQAHATEHGYRPT